MLGLSLGLGLGPGRGGGGDGGYAAYIVPIIGQSNDAGSNDGSTADPSEFTPDARILQVSGDASGGDALVPAEERLSFPSATGPSTAKGYGLPFAKTLLPTLGANDIIVLVPLAVGGTAYFDPNRWNIGGDLHDNAISRVNAAKVTVASDYPDHNQRFIWLSAAGENDVSDIKNGTEWLGVVVAAHQNLLTQTGSTGSSIVMPTMPADWVSGNNAARAIDSARVRLARALPNVATVESQSGDMADSIHYNAAGQTRRGKAMATAYPASLGRSSPRSISADWVDSAGATCEGAYSYWRRLRSAYSGPAFRVRRNGDLAEQDVGFTASGELDYDAFNNFLDGDALATIVVFYDQSGNGRDFVANGANTTPEASIVTNTIDTVDRGDFVWANGVPTIGGSNQAITGTLITPAFELNVGGYVYMAANFNWGSNDQVISSQNLQLTTEGATDEWQATAFSGSSTTGTFSMTSEFHTVLISDQYARVDGEVQTLSSGDPQNATYAGATTLMGRQLANGGNIAQRSNTRMAEMVFFASQPTLSVIDEASEIYQFDAKA